MWIKIKMGFCLFIFFDSREEVFAVVNADKVQM
jgi:hypothetical protein